jgi:predicted ferric reductase
MRNAFKGVLIGLFLLALLGAIATRAGWIVASPPRPQGTGAWMFSRATGLVAYVALSIDVIVGLLVSTRSADRLVQRGQLIDVHGWLSPLTLALVLAHAVVLLADRYVRFDIVDVFVPFASGRWSLAVGVGVLAGYLMLVVHLSFGMRKRIGTTTWRRLHYLSYAAFVLVTIHAMAVGSDRANPWFASVYAVLLLVVASLLALRIRRTRAAIAASGKHL